jgi:hypothetical protein
LNCPLHINKIGKGEKKLKRLIKTIAVISLLSLLVTLPTLTVTKVSASWFLKPSYPDYAPSGVPDFDEKQVGWGPGPGIYTWCGPVAVANSLWWLDSEYESIFNPAPVPPPVMSDAFPLVSSYNPQVWDDHDPQNVDPLVRNLAFLMDTDGQQSGDGHLGTRFLDMVNGIQNYLIMQGVPQMFEVHSQIFPDFFWIEEEIERCQDVVLFLEFYQLTEGGWIQLYDNPSLEFGHCVTCAGVNSTTLELLISDPWQDAFEAGTAPMGGRSPVPHPYPHPAQFHNDAQFVSQDAYQATQYMLMPPPPPPAGYPPIVWELSQYLQTMGYPPMYHAFITGAVVTSPTSVPDVAVTNVDPSKDYLGEACPHTPVGFCSNISVTVANQGTLTETFDVTLYANGTQIEIQTVTNLPAGSVQTLIFCWNSSGFIMGNYSIRADAETLPGEIDTADNTLTDGPVRIGIPCDITSANVGVPDGRCDMRDIGYFAGKFGTTPLIQGWDPNADVTGPTTGYPDSSVNMRDIGEACKHFGEHE